MAEYLVDVEQRQFRQIDNCDNMVGMHTEKGRKMVEEMIGTEWRVYGLDKAVLEPEQGGSVTFLLNHTKGTKIPAI